jgi:hypothetical protein
MDLNRRLILLYFLLILILCSQLIRKMPQVFSATEHIVFSEIQIGKSGTGHADDEFIELYNPTLNEIPIDGWQIKRKTANQTTAPTFLVGLTGNIKPHGYKLIAHANYVSIPVMADIFYSSGSIAPDNTLFLYDNINADPVDKVGYGTAGDKETADAPSPPVTTAGKSIERKANANSTFDSMKSGGYDEFSGNGQDSGNNAEDFIIRDSPDPQNSNSVPEPEIIPTQMPTITPTLTLTPSPTPSEIPTPTPTEIPTPSTTPSPTEIPTPTPTATPEPTETATPIPTLTPTNVILPSNTPTTTVNPIPTTIFFPSSTPTQIPKPTPSINPSWFNPFSIAKILFSSHIKSCHLEIQTIFFGKILIRLPALICR